MVNDQKARSLGIYLTVLAAFLAAYGVNSLAAPSFLMAIVGGLIFSYGLIN
jgi:hypothetical protein